MNALSKYVFYPLWEVKDGSRRLTEWRILEKQQWWERSKLYDLQWDRLLTLLRYASEHSPFYRARLADKEIDVSSITNESDFRALPVTTKRDLRNNLDQFISEEYDRNQLLTAKTGGSTGLSLKLYFDETCQERRNAAQIMADRWAGWDLGDKTASIWGNPPIPRTLKQRLRNRLRDRTIYLDTMELNDKSMGNFVSIWRTERPKTIFGHAHSIYIFAKYLNEKRIRDLRPKGIVATSMMLLQHERQTIEDTFGCPVTNRYGCEEVGLIACECEKHDGMHLNVPHVYVEFLDDNDNPVPPGEPGKIVVTDLNNFAMPLIRYRVEDVGVYRNTPCECGRGLPILSQIEGRVADFLKLPNGGQVAGVSLVERTLTKVSGIEQMQLIQEELNTVIINRVKGQEYCERSDIDLIKEMRKVFDSRVELIVKDVTDIPQERSGKYRFSICKV